jgi:hypothetical protein
MTITQRYFFKPDDLQRALLALDMFETPVDGYIRAVYTRQRDVPWKYCIGVCVLGQVAGDDLREVYTTFAFISQTLRGVTVRNLLESLTGDTGIRVAPDLPPLHLTASPSNWREEIVPSHATASSLPARRFKISLEANAVFANDQLIDFSLPYRPSADRYVKEFLRMKPQDSIDGQRGEFTIEVPERRGAIRMSDGRLSIHHPAVPLRLLGEIDGRPVDLKSDDVLEIDHENVRHVELWLLTQNSEIVDYVSATHWPYKYSITPKEAEQEQMLLELIRHGESETCEFKPYIDLDHEKAPELEKTVCAFANQRGGTLFIGITDEGDIVGLARDLTKRPDDLDRAIAEYEKDVCKRLRETLKDNQCFKSRIATVAGTRLIVVEVEPSSEVNFIVKSELAQMAYIRHGATSTRMSPPEIGAKGGDNADAQSILRNAVFSQ